MTPLERWLAEHMPPYSWDIAPWQEDSIEIGILCIILFGVSAGVYKLVEIARRRWKR